MLKIQHFTFDHFYIIDSKKIINLKNTRIGLRLVSVAGSFVAEFEFVPSALVTTLELRLKFAISFGFSYLFQIKEH